MLGHSSITVTLDRYGHLMPSLAEYLADALDARMRSVESRAAAGYLRDRPKAGKPRAAVQGS
jgi:hypothetical protein